MKSSAIVRIVIWSAVAIFLIAFLINGINGNEMFGLNVSFFGYNYDNSSDYLMADGSMSVSDIKNVDINWISGKIKVIEHDSSNIEFYEEESHLNDDDKLRYLVKDGELKIQFKKAKKMFSFPFGKSYNKTLVIKVPASDKTQLNRFNIDAVSASLEVENLTARNISVEVVSGKVDMENVKSEVLDIETVSGGTKISGQVDFLEVDGVSGQIVADLENCPKEIKAETVSGSINVYIPENEGFSVDYDSVSGRFRCDFEVKMSKKEAVYKNGKSNFKLETVSGGININKK